MHIIYNANEATTGSVPVDATDYIEKQAVPTALNTGNLVRDNYTWVGWNDASDGTGTSYAGDTCFAMGLLDITLYAQWVCVCSASLGVVGDEEYPPVIIGNTDVGVETLVRLRSGNCLSAPPLKILDGQSVVFSAKETKDSTIMYQDRITTTIVDKDNGLVKLDINKEDVPFSGIWWAAFMLVNDSNGSIVSELIPTWLYVKKGIEHKISENTPLGIADLRLFLKDRCSSDNSLLDQVEFDDDMLLAAIRWPVDQWNEIPPSVGSYTQTTFPWRYHWMVGAAGMALRSAAYNYERNDLSYNAGGTHINDKHKASAYSSLSQQLQQEYMQWVGAKKTEINQALAWGTMTSGVY